MNRSIKCTLIAATLLFSTFSTTIFADENQAPSEQEKSQLTSTFTSLENVPAPTITQKDEIKERLEAIEEKAVEVFAETKSQEEVNNFLKDEGFIVINPGSDETANADEIVEKSVSKSRKIGTLSTEPGMVIVNQPTVTYDTQTGKYRIATAFSWQRDSEGPYWLRDIPYPCCDAVIYTQANIGGLDQFGIYIKQDTDLKNVGVNTFATVDNNGSVYNYGSPANSNSFGVSFTQTDRVRYGKSSAKGMIYNWHAGTLSAYFTVGKKGTTYEVTPQFDHTWSETDITSVSVQPYGIGISWARGGYSFRQTSNIPLYWKP